MAGRSLIASRTVTARRRAFLPSFTARYEMPPGRLMQSCGDAKTVRGCGHAGSVSPGAAAQMKVRLRDCDTPKLPALSTPKRTCRHGTRTLQPLFRMDLRAGEPGAR